jgi:hypothetical protein
VCCNVLAVHVCGQGGASACDDGLVSLSLSSSLEASLPQETAEKPYEQNVTQGYRCADVSMQGCLDIESDSFASSDKLQLNSISGTRSVSPREDKRHPSTPVLSTYGNIWDDSDSSDPGVVKIALEMPSFTFRHSLLDRLVQALAIFTASA